MKITAKRILLKILLINIIIMTMIIMIEGIINSKKKKILIENSTLHRMEILFII